MRLTIHHGAQPVADIACPRLQLRMGWGSDCEIQLPGSEQQGCLAMLSPGRHDRWAIWPDPLFREQLTLNGSPLRESLWLSSGDELHVADVHIKVSDLTPIEDHEAMLALGDGSVDHIGQFKQTNLPFGSFTRTGNETLSLRPEDTEQIARYVVTLSQTDSVHRLMDVALDLLVQEFRAQRAWIGIRRKSYGSMDYEEGRHADGTAVELPEFGARCQSRVIDRRQFVCVPYASEDHDTSVLTGPLHAVDGILGMLYLERSDSDHHFDAHDLDHFAMCSRLIGGVLDAILQQVARNRAAMIDGEVSVAHATQARLTPRKLPQWDTLHFGALRETGSEHSGDIYDVARSEAGFAYVMLAQTPSRGPIPGILMAQAQSAFRYAAMHQDTPAAFLGAMNWLLYNGQQDHPLNCFAACINPEDGALHYALAGDVGALIFDDRGEPRDLRPNAIQPSLSTERGTQYVLRSTRLEAGETLALFSSGILHARNRAGEEFGEERLTDLLGDGFGLAVGARLEDLQSELKSFSDFGFQPLDVTVLLAHRALD